MSINIAIDGPAGAGKSTIAKRVAKELEYIYVDTGAMYRAMAYYFLQKGISPEDEGKISEECKNAEISIAYQNGEQQVILNGENVTAYIRKEEVGNMASATSVYPKVREKLVELQKELAKKSNVIMDGRDIGTCVLPDAQVKIYLTASVQTRAKRRYDELKEKGYGPMLQKRTGLVPDAYFSASKIAWILDHVKGAREAAEKGELLFGTVDTWLIWNLTKGAVHVTDYTNAARTMLFDIHRCCWEEEILELFRIPKEMLPEVRPSSGFFGETQEQIFGGKIPVMGVAGDQQAALFGQCCFEKGDVKNTYGTGCFLLMHTGKEPIISRHGLLTTIAAGTAGEVEYALEGSVFVAGAAIQWLRDGMRMIRTAGQSEEYAKRVPDSNGVYIVPAFAGMGAPYWNPYARGTIVGLTRGCKKEHFIRATLESIAYQAKDVIHAMEEDAGVTLNGLRVDGGASANNMLVQFQADIIDAAVLRPECIETTALGAAYLAGLAAGYWKDRDEIRENWQLGRRFEPVMDSGERKKLLRGWQRAVRCARLWAEDGE